MLRPGNYIIIDLETTGLDILKDEPVQIGMLVFNEQFEVIHSFSSYIKPPTRSGELKEIVQYLTGITAEQILNAPDIHRICEQIRPRLNENVIMVGHNVSFDLQMLGKYMHIPHSMAIDTYDIARITHHFLPSYSLSVIYDNTLQSAHGDIPQICKNIKAHDALSDCIMTRYIFQDSMNRIIHLLHKYPTLRTICTKSQGRLSSLLVCQNSASPAYELPPLKKSSPLTKKPLTQNPINIKDLGSGKKYSIQNKSLSSFFSQLPLGKDPVIFSFAHKPKTNIAKAILQDLGYPVSTFHDNYEFNPDMVSKLLSKSNIDHEEFIFLIKYHSALEKGHTILDLNTEGDYKIFSALTTLKSVDTAECIVSTHDQLRTFSHKITPQSIVLFFDHERRFQTAKKQANQQTDLLYFLTFCDQLAYKYALSQHPAATQLAEFAARVTIFVGVLHMELSHLFCGYQSNELEVESIRNHTRLPKTHHMYTLLLEYTKSLISLLFPEDITKLNQHMARLHTLGEHACLCNKQIRGGEKRYFTFTPSQAFVSYEDMIQQLPDAQYLFLTHTSNPQYTPIALAEDTATENKERLVPKLHTISDPKAIIHLATERIKTLNNPCIYVVSSTKINSQRLFNLCIAQGMQHIRNIQGENITGGHGSALFQAAKFKGPRLIIGGFNFFLQACAKGIPFTDIVAYNLEGPLKHHIMADVIYYANTHTAL